MLKSAAARMSELLHEEAIEADGILLSPKNGQGDQPRKPRIQLEFDYDLKIDRGPEF